ncbi:MAG: glycosyl hydrolase family 28-related protein [Pyrinomonadaceae bacterium]
MSKNIPVVFLFVFIFTISTVVRAQSNRFEGYNIILDAPETHRGATCAIRYSPANSDITVSDLDSSTPMNLRPCPGSGTNINQSGLTATMRATVGSGKWCFEGEDKKYRISFRGDQFSGPVSYDWIPTPENPGVYNVRDFGAVGDGRTDDTMAIRSALAFLASRNGGILQFGEGDFVVGNVPNFKGLVLPSGVTIQGISGLQSGASTNNIVQKNASRITLKGSNRALFRIGECTEKVSIRDIELFAESSQNTYGVEALGAYTSSQGFVFENVSFSRFYRGIYAYGLRQTDKNWQFDYIKISDCRFVFNTDAGIYTDIRNSDWKIEGSFFINPRRTAAQKADSMHFERVTAVLVQDTFGGGFAGSLGGTFLNILDSGVLTVIGSQTENMTNSLVYNETGNQYAGDYSYPINFVNCVFGNPIIFKARRTFVSTGTLYLGDTFQADERLRVYSTGDRFCYDGYILGCQGATKKNFDRATVVFMTGQPGERNIPDTPTYFGTDVQFGAPVQMPVFRQNELPRGKPDGSMVYCSNCRRDTDSCQAGGSGAPAMVVNGQWSCL